MALERLPEVSLDLVDALLLPCWDHRSGGIDERYKQRSALNYAMLAGHGQLVTKVQAFPGQMLDVMEHKERIGHLLNAIVYSSLHQIVLHVESICSTFHAPIMHCSEF